MTDDTPTSGEEALDHFDLTTGMDFNITAATVNEIAQTLEEAESIDPEDEGTLWLAEWVEALKALENAAEDARKEVFEAELKDRVSTGTTVGNLRKTPGTNTYVTDHAGAFDAVLDAGKDPRNVAKVSASDLKDVLGEDAEEYIGKSEYSYFRRQG